MIVTTLEADLPLYFKVPARVREADRDHLIFGVASTGHEARLLAEAFPARMAAVVREFPLRDRHVYGVYHRRA